MAWKTKSKLLPQCSSLSVLPDVRQRKRRPRLIYENSRAKPSPTVWPLSNCIEIGLKKDIEAFDKYTLIRRNAEMILNRSRFSSGFHKEDISSTVFAQAWAVFLLRAAGFWLRVGAAKTWEFSELAGWLRQGLQQPVILEGESPGDISETRANANWLPGRCGLLPDPAHEWEWAAGPRSGCALWSQDRECSQLWQMRHSLGSAVGPEASSRRVSGGWGESEGPRTMRLGWLAPAAFLFGETFFAADLRGFSRKN
jgi:hypothetical protein